jgi:methionine sulfoxide reductase heme-binding subunit
VRTDPTFWVLTRASGLTAYSLVTLSVLAGLVLKSRPFPRPKPAAVTDMHRFLTTLALGATAVHGTSLLVDTKIPLTFQELVVPGIAPYQPLWTGVGVVAAEVMVVVYLSFSARRWIGTKAWRRLHWTTYGIFVAVTSHGVMNGTDGGQSWVVALYVGSIGAVAAATCWRFLAPPATRREKSA